MRNTPRTILTAVAILAGTSLAAAAQTGTTPSMGTQHPSATVRPDRAIPLGQNGSMQRGDRDNDSAMRADRDRDRGMTGHKWIGSGSSMRHHGWDHDQKGPAASMRGDRDDNRGLKSPGSGGSVRHGDRDHQNGFMGRDHDNDQGQRRMDQAPLGGH